MMAAEIQANRELLREIVCGSAPAGRGGTGDEYVALDSIAAENCATGLNRSAGFRASARWSASATAAGTAGRRLVIGGASTTRRCRTIDSAVGPVNGGCPPSIS